MERIWEPGHISKTRYETFIHVKLLWRVGNLHCSVALAPIRSWVVTVTPNARLPEVVSKRNPAIGHSHTSHVFASCILNRIHLRTIEYIVTYIHIYYIITVHQCMAFSPVDSSSAVAVKVAVVAGGGGGGGVQYLKAHLAHDLVQFLVWIESIKHRP